MSLVMHEATVAGCRLSRAERLRRFMGAYWLRPENALWMALRSDVLSGSPWRSPSVDVSCGDGVFSFLHAGGAFDDDFDVFRGTAGTPTRSDSAAAWNADIFDHVDERYLANIVQPPGYRIDVGTDWKPNLLVKAGLLDLYDELMVHDNNCPLPFEDGSFATVYSNSTYWVEQIDHHLHELRRITAADGCLLLEIKLDSVLRYTLQGHQALLGDRFLDLIDRGRAASWPSLSDRQTWERRFERAGLRIERAVPFVTRTLAQIWDVGLRPIAPMLIELANGVTPQTRADVKRRWVDLFCELCAPFCEPSMDLFSEPSEPAEILYELRPA